MAQFGRPTDDISAGQWSPSTGTDLFAMIDESSADDSDWIESTTNRTGACEVGLTSSLVDPVSSSDHIVRYRLRRSATNKSYTVVVSLREAASTTIASWKHVDPSDTFTTFNQTLSAAEADSITDYTDLSLHFNQTVVNGPPVRIEVSWAEFEVPSATTATLLPSGIASGEAFGTAQVNLSVAPTAIGGAEAFGTTQVNLSVAPSGVASAETFGSSTFIGGGEAGSETAAIVGPAGGTVGSDGGRVGPGSTTSSQTLVVSGIGTAEAVGTPSLVQLITPTGLASLEAFGTTQVNLEIIASAIASAEAIGTAKLISLIAPTGIAGAEAFGTTTVTTTAILIEPTGIATAEQIGTNQVVTSNVNVQPTGIATAEAVGTPSVVYVITASGIFSAEAVGEPTLDLTIFPTAKDTDAAFGTTEIVTVVPIEPTGITSGAAFGTAALALSGTILPSGIAGAEAFGDLDTVPGAITVTPSAIAGAEAFGTAQLNFTIITVSIESAEQPGTPLLSVSAVTITPTGIASGAAFGTALIQLGIVAIIAAFGTVKRPSNAGAVYQPSDTGTVESDRYGDK